MIVNDELLLNTIAQVFEEVIAAHKPKINETDSDQLLGEKYRGYEGAKTLVEEMMRQLMMYQRQEVLSKKFNRAK